MKTTATKKLVVLISGSGSNLQAIMDACERGAINADISLVISNQKNAYGLQRAAQKAIPTLTLEHTSFPSREAFDSALLDSILNVDPDLVILAGFMRILSASFVDALTGKLINIHPSLLPKYRGLHTHQRVLDAGDAEHGVSVHFVTAELDGGPIIAQAKCVVEPGDCATSLSAKVQTLEHMLYPTVVRWWCEDRLSWIDDHTILFNQTIVPATGIIVSGTD